MKKLLFAALFLLFGSVQIQAGVLSPQAKLLVSEFEEKKPVKQEKDLPAEFKEFAEKHELRFLNGQWYSGAMLLVDDRFSGDEIEKFGGIVRSELGEVVTISIPVEALFEIAEIPGIKYVQAGVGDAPFLDRVVVENEAEKVHQGEDLKMPYTGEGVVVGVTDNGFHYLHPAFKNRKDSSFRIKSVWNQREDDLFPPGGFTYGMELSTPEHFHEFKHDEREGSHGTHVAGIAGGWDVGTPYSGIAYDSDLIFVRHQRDISARVDAFRYIKEQAQKAGKPAVINTSWGNYQGPMDGTSLLSRAINYLSESGTVFVSSAGNTGHTNYHLKQDFQSDEDSLHSMIGFSSSDVHSNYWGQSLTIWGSPGQELNMVVKLLDNNGEVVEIIDTLNSHHNSSVNNVINLDTGYVELRVEGNAVSPINDKPHLMMRIAKENLDNHHVAFSMAAKGEGEVHLWNLVERNNYSNRPEEFYGGFTKYINGDSYHGIGEPAVTEEMIAVGSHGLRGNPDVAINSGQLSSFSSRGPTADGRIKPEITAIGESVASAISSFDEDLEDYIIEESIAWEEDSFYFRRTSGTSMSAPVVSGVVALMLQIDPDLDFHQVMSVLSSTATSDNITGSIPEEGSPFWGQGKLNAWEALKQTEIFTNIPEEKRRMHSGVRVFPNPIEDSRLTVRLRNESKAEISMFAIDGREIPVSTEKMHNNEIMLQWDSNLQPGTYIVQIANDNETFRERLILQ